MIGKNTHSPLKQILKNKAQQLKIICLFAHQMTLATGGFISNRKNRYLIFSWENAMQ